ncbi:MAG TPA: patatin-like phospholipase family protein [Spirochaetota bacterium]|nr:patatin-like phospholipase family protein [Spirochaetota bacterium]HPS86419.1 patatin-like phospholipase family protein [Spirochaetota bacterium]
MINPMKFFRNRKVGLALGSGGAKGLSHIAVIEYLENLKIPVDMISGSSIGAVIGSVYLCGNLNKLKADMLTFSKKELLSIADITLPKSGLIKGNNFIKFLTKYIPADAKIEDLPKPLAIVATDYYTGKPIIFRKGNILEAIRASISIPGVFVPASYGNTFLLDGGVANPLPIDVLKSMGAGFTIAVNLHPRLKVSEIKKYVKKGAEKIGINLFPEEIQYADDKHSVSVPDYKKESRGWFSNINTWLAREKEKDLYPSIFEVLFQSIDIMEYVNTLNTLKYHTPTVLIEPDLPNTGTLDFYDAKNIITVGYAASADKKFELVRKIKFWI